jgi:hypothetical protein
MSARCQVTGRTVGFGTPDMALLPCPKAAR